MQCDKEQGVLESSYDIRNQTSSSPHSQSRTGAHRFAVINIPPRTSHHRQGVVVYTIIHTHTRLMDRSLPGIQWMARTYACMAVNLYPHAAAYESHGRRHTMHNFIEEKNLPIK